MDIEDDDADRNPARHPWVYFLRCPANGLIKIGFTGSQASWARFQDIATASPVPLEPMGLLPGGRSLEAALHVAFAPHCHHAEWFEPAPVLLDFIRREARPWIDAPPRKFGDPIVRRRAKLIAEYRYHYSDGPGDRCFPCDRCGRIMAPEIIGPCHACRSVKECEPAGADSPVG